MGRTARRVGQRAAPGAPPEAVPRQPAARRRLYVSVTWKLALAQTVAVGWLGVSIWLSLPWVDDLASAVGIVLAIVAVSLVAYVPGWLVAFLAASLLLDRQPPVREAHPTVPVTVLIATRNEAERIEETIAYIARQDYQGPVSVLVADNGSTDGTRAIAEAFGAASGLDVRCIVEPRPGKSHALNTGLAAVRTELVITLDADTLLHPRAIRQLVSRLLSSPDDVRAVAGSVLVRNSRDNLWTRMQEWDYFLGIASVKRMQGLYQGTLVAQGAFSLYRTEAVLAAGGWPDAIGEDIMLTWQLMRQGADMFDLVGKVRYIGVNSGFDGTTELAAIKQRTQVAVLVQAVLKAPFRSGQVTEGESCVIAFHLLDRTAVTRGFHLGTGRLEPGVFVPRAFLRSVTATLRAAHRSCSGKP